MSKQMKVERGTARMIRRSDMAVFRNERAKMIALNDRSTFNVKVAPRRNALQPLNPHLRDVAAIVAIGNGQAIVRICKSTTTYPANVPSPFREQSFQYAPMPCSRAIQIAARVNAA